MCCILNNMKNAVSAKTKNKKYYFDFNTTFYIKLTVKNNRFQILSLV